MEYNNPINIHVDTYKEARITAIQLFKFNGYDSNIYCLTKDEWENGTPLYIKVWNHDFIIAK